jgi:uncharacterized protein (DUF983 family)
VTTPDPGPRPGDLTPWAARSTGGQRLRRGLAGRCPRCGADDIKDGFFDLAERCPSCTWTFEREEGYWVGAMVVIFAVVEVLFALLLLVGILATWPDVPWTVLLIAGLVLNAASPFLLYRWSKGVWIGLHTAFVPAELEDDEANRYGHA